MIKTKLFYVTQANMEMIPYVLKGLRNAWTSADYQFNSKFNTKTGDYDIFLLTNFEPCQKLIETLTHYNE